MTTADLQAIQLQQKISQLQMQIVSREQMLVDFLDWLEDIDLYIAYYGPKGNWVLTEEDCSNQIKKFLRGRI